MQYTQECLKETGIRLLFKWGKKHWIQFTVKGF